jgi:alpha-L-fucosidase
MHSTRMDNHLVMSSINSRTSWFTGARLGMFIHWGAYAVAGRGEWVRSHERLSIQDYQPYIDAFVPKHFDPHAWADAAAEAGMKYAVMTAKHHDGFCLFDSAHTSYTTMHTGFGRDAVAEYTQAFRARGIKVGLYYSLLDWHHPAYPSYGDLHHPHRDDPDHQVRQPDFNQYLDYMHAQIRELCTNYGTLDLMWLDFSYGEMRSQTWRAEQLVTMIRNLQPDIILNNRLETSADGFGSLATGSPSPWAGDFVSPEQLIPAEGIRDHYGRPIPWEACITLDNHWGYNPSETNNMHKPGRLLTRKLIETVAKSGNLLLNVGPDPDGLIPERSLQSLRELGAWVTGHAPSIYNAGHAPLPKPEWGYYTQNDDTIYAHVIEPPVGPLALTGIKPSDITKIVNLTTGQPMQLAESWVIHAYPDTAFISFGPEPAHTYPLPNDTATVVAIMLTENWRPAADVRD